MLGSADDLKPGFAIFLRDRYYGPVKTTRGRPLKPDDQKLVAYGTRWRPDALERLRAIAEARTERSVDGKPVAIRDVLESLVDAAFEREIQRQEMSRRIRGQQTPASLDTRRRRKPVPKKAAYR